MYTWNKIKINISGTNKGFITDIGKYLHASYSGSGDKDSDIDISIYHAEDNMLPPISQGAKLKKSITLTMEKEFELKIYKKGEEFWYLYQDIADYWLDLENNKLVISIHDKPFSFKYYNILIFFLYPLGLLLENFGFYRMHSSCIDIGGRAVLVTGQSGSGKSTSAFALALNGASIVSDDLTFIKRTGDHYAAHTITRLVKLHGITMEKFYPELSGLDSLKNDEGEVYFDESDINKKTVEKSTLDSIVILEKTGKRSSSITKVHPSQVISHLFPSSIQINNGKFTHNKFIFLTDMLNDIACYKVHFGTDMKNFYRNITGMLKNGNK